MGTASFSMTDFPLAPYSGHRPEQVLASWGLTSLLPGARIRFEGPWAEPVISWGGTADEHAQTAAQGLVEFTASLRQGAMAAITTTTPTRSAFNIVSTDAWQHINVTDAGLPTSSGSITNLFDASSSADSLSSTANARADIRVRAAALTLYSGKSYTVKSVEDTWLLLLPAGTTLKAEMPTDLMVTTARHAIATLLVGELSAAVAKPALRFSAYDPSPRTATGYEAGDVIPLTDLLALCGQMLIQPRQYGTAATAGKTLTWIINAEPLTIQQVIDLHEAPPQHLPWPRWESSIGSTGSEAKFSILHTAHNVPSQHGGDHV